MIERQASVVCDRCRRRVSMSPVAPGQVPGLRDEGLLLIALPKGWESYALHEPGGTPGKNGEFCPGCVASFDVFLTGKATSAAEAP